MWWILIRILLIAESLMSPGEGTTLSTDLLGCVVVNNASCPDQDYIQFNLYTRLNPKTPQNIILSPDNLHTTSFDPDDPTKIILHGYNTNGADQKILDLKNQYIIGGDHNLIIIDWGALCAGATCYPAAMGNAYHVAECVAGLIKMLRSEAVTDIHVIGHSLGGQIAGLTANYLKPYILPKITGLDLAGPIFEFYPNEKKLDPTDAIFVEVLHSNVLENGVLGHSGHVDYYFNGGKFQPGCGLPILSAVCSHERAIEYYAESINSVAGFWGWQCSTVARFLSGRCGVELRTIRLGNETNRGIVVVPTGTASLFALGV